MPLIDPTPLEKYFQDGEDRGRKVGVGVEQYCFLYNHEYSSADRGNFLSLSICFLFRALHFSLSFLYTILSSVQMHLFGFPSI